MRRRIRLHFDLVLLACLCSAAPASAQAQLEPEFTQRLGSTNEATEAQLLELAGWSRERGWEREALNALRLCASRFPASAPAHAMLHEDLVDGRWLPASADPSALRAAPVDLSLLEPQRRAALDAARDRVFAMAKSSLFFDFWTDLDRSRVEHYVRVMNPYYSRLKSFFRVARTEAAAQVFLFSTRSDYLGFYELIAEKSGEHTSGFFTTAGNVSLLSFYDVPHDPEVFETARHEGTHLLMSQSLHGAEAPRWLNEGLACYFAGDAEERSGAYVASCFVTARHAARTGTAPSFRELTETPADDFGFREYALSWSWVAYLLESPDTAARLPKLWTELREIGEAQDTTRWSDEDWERQGNDAFQRVVSPSAAFQAGWAAFVESELAPRTADQCREAAAADLALIRAPGALLPALEPAQRVELLHEAEAWSRRASEGDDPSQRVANDLLRMDAALTRSRVLDYDRDELASTLDQASQSIDALLSDADARASAAQIARFLQPLLAESAGSGQIEDLRAHIARSEGRSASATDAEEADALRELGSLHLRLGVLERLVELSRRASAAALVGDPLDRRAMLSLLELTLRHQPDELEALLPHLLFQTQVDPDDRHLAALAAAMSTLGAPGYADALLCRAGAITPDPASVQAWADVVAQHREPARAHPDGCRLCGGASWIRCGRCKSQGTYDALCSTCHGKRQIECGACDGAKRRACGHCGGSGKIEWENSDETDACKLCTKGEVKCPLCRGAGQIDCPDCAGKGRVSKPCDACFAVGWLPCPLADASDPCRLCERSGQMPCPACLGVGSAEASCKTCGGWGAVFCERGCVAGRVACAGCSGTGRVHLVFVDSNSKAGSSKCADCGGRGFEKCPACDGQGIQKCAVRERGKPCAHCNGSGQSPCAVSAAH